MRGTSTMSEMSDFTPKQRSFMQWLATPKHERKPRRMEDFAKELNVSDRTLCRWKRLPGFLDALYEEALIAVGDRLPTILHAQAGEAEDGDVRAAELILTVTGHYKKKFEVESPHTLAELLRLADRARTDSGTRQPDKG